MKPIRQPFSKLQTFLERSAQGSFPGVVKRFQLIALLTVVSLFFGIQNASAHGVQIGYCVLNNGFLRVYVEHWHGNNPNLSSSPLSVTTQFGTSTVTQTIGATGSVANTAWNNLPGCGAGITILGGCPGTGFGSANFHNDWVYYDFAPAACNQAVTITINSGTTVVTTEACSQLYPQTITTTFNDNAPPI